MRRHLIPLVLLIVSVSLNVILGRQNRDKTELIAELKAASRLALGTIATSLSVRDLMGRAVQLDVVDTSQNTILYVFTPTCGWCTRNLDNLQAVIANAPGRYRVVGLSLDAKGVEEYVRRHRLTIPIFTSPSDDEKRRYRLSATPYTVVIDTTGRVTHVWIGVFGGSVQDEVESLLSLRLPGVRPAGV